MHLRFELATDSVDLPGGAALVLKSSKGAGQAEELDYLQWRASGLYTVPGPASDPLTQAAGATESLHLGLTAGKSAVLFDKTLNLDFDRDGRLDIAETHIEQSVVGLESVWTYSGTFADAIHVRTIATSTLRLSVDPKPRKLVAIEDAWYVAGVGPVHIIATSSVDDTQVSNRDELLFAYGVGTKHSQPSGAQLVSASPAGTPLLTTATTITLSFNKPLNPMTLYGSQGLYLQKDGEAAEALGFTLSADMKTVTIQVGSLPDGNYSIGAGSKASDLAGHKLPAALYRFGVDMQGPLLLSSAPAHGSKGVPLTGQLVLNFSEPLYAATGVTPCILLEPRPTCIAAQIDGRSLRATLPSQLYRNASYRFSAGPGLTDVSGNPVVFHGVDFSTDVGSFSLPIQLLDRQQNTTVVIADIDGHGRQDLAFTQSAPKSAGSQLFVQSRMPDGSLARPVQRSAFPDDKDIRSGHLIAGNFSGTGRTDLLFESPWASALLQQDSSGQFQWESTNQSAKKRSPRIQFGGTTASGLSMIARTAGPNFDFSVRESAGNWRTVMTLAIGGEDRSSTLWEDVDWAARDLNNDGKLDLIWTRQSSNSATQCELVWALQQSGGFGPEHVLAIPGCGDSVRKLAIGDINGDKREDVVLYSPGFSGRIYIQQADGSFKTDDALFLDMPAVDAVLIGDVNGDGRADLILAGGGLFVDIRLQNASGGWEASRSYPNSAGSELLPGSASAILDYDGDGLTDLIIGGSLLLGRQRSGPWPLVTDRPPQGSTTTATRIQRLNARGGPLRFIPLSSVQH